VRQCNPRGRVLVAYDDAGGVLRYKNSTTNESQWVPPEGSTIPNVPAAQPDGSAAGAEAEDDEKESSEEESSEEESSEDESSYEEESSEQESEDEAAIAAQRAAEARASERQAAEEARQSAIKRRGNKNAAQFEREEKRR
jgi:hypothetical protein